jgi:hypothetical protein
MQKFIISIKDKNTGRDFISPFTVDSLDGFGDCVERFTSYGCLVIIDSITEENDFFELSRKFELSKSANNTAKFHQL